MHATLRNENGLPGQWSHVATSWHLIGSPLRPVDDDLAAFQRVIDRWCREHPDQPPRGLILGVTPEIHDLAWPDRSRLRAVDHDARMIRHVWPGDPAAVIQTDWLDIGLPAGSVDIVFCDGGLHLLGYPQDQQCLVEHLARTVAPGGYAVFRLFTPSPVEEDADAVLGALEAGRIPSLNHLKLRLWSALQRDPAEGVCLADVWTTLHRLVRSDWRELAERLNWDPAELAMIDAYRDRSARYHLVTPGEATQMFSTHGFRRLNTFVPRYPQGRQCPTLVFIRS